MKEETTEPQSRLRWLLIGLFLFWLAISIAGYYWVQNALLQPVWEQIGNTPWALPRLSLAAIGRTSFHLFVALWMAFAALGIGIVLLDRVPILKPHNLERLVLALGIGFGGLGLLVFVLGLVGLLNGWVFYGLMVLLTLLTGWQSFEFVRRLRVKKPERKITLFLAFSLTFALTLALLPPTDWDGLFYHLTGPKLYLEAGRLVSGIDIPHLSFPALFEMLFMMALGMGSEISAVLIHFIFQLMTAGMVYLIAKDLLGVQNSWLAVLFFYATPMVLTLSGWAYNDLGLAFYETAALYALVKYLRDRTIAGTSRKRSAGDKEGAENKQMASVKIGWLVLSAVFSGLAMGMKYTSFVAPLTLVVVLVWEGRERLGGLVRPLLLFGLVALVVALPWFAKNLAFTGNPVYPFVFGGEYWDDFRADAYSEAGTGIAYNPASCTAANQVYLVGQHASDCEIDLGYLAVNLLTLPYLLTLGIRDANLTDGISGPLFLIFLPFIIGYGLFKVGGKKPPGFKVLLIFALAHYLFWTVGVISSAALWQSRLLLPAFVVLCPVLAWIYEDLPRFDHPKFSLHRQLRLILGLVLIVGLLIQFVTWLPQQPWHYLIGSETEGENLRRRLGAHYGAMALINADLDEEDVVVFLWEPRSFYCETAECRPDSILDRFGHLQYLYEDAPTIADNWREEGVTHVLLFRSGLELILEANSPTDEPLPEPAVLTDLLSDHLVLVDTVAGDVYELYQLVPDE